MVTRYTVDTDDPLWYTLSMTRFLIFTLTVLLLTGLGCAVPKSPVPAEGEQSTPSPPSSVVTLDIFGGPVAWNWDADPEIDGLRVEIRPKDADENPMAAPGIVSAKLWLQEAFLESEKGELIQTWAGIPVTKDDYSSICCAIVYLEYIDFFPTERQYGILEVTLTTDDGKSFTDRYTGAYLGE